MTCAPAVDVLCYCLEIRDPEGNVKKTEIGDLQAGTITWMYPDGRREVHHIAEGSNAIE
jgi:hypothetical protein